MNLTYFVFFLFILTGTLIITYWAAERGGTTNQFYSMSGSLTGFQNGLAIAGDYISAASFLGIAGAIALSGFDGFYYSIGFLVSYLLLLFLIAEPIRNLGKFTLADVICSRFPGKQMRIIVSLSTLSISILYIIPQLSAAGLLIKLLLGIDYATAVIVIGGLMTIYVAFGGMIATSWVQIIKTVFLTGAVFLLSLIVLSRFDWNMINLLEKVQQGTPLADGFFKSGNLFSSPLETISLQLALIFGTAGLPHILVRFFTVKDASAVRRSVVTATWIIGLFYVMTLILGFGVIAFVGWDTLMLMDPTGNLSAPILASALGGDFLMAFVSAVAFVTILAVVTGLVIAATSSFTHDIYNHVLKKGIASEKGQLRVAKLAAVLIGFISIVLALEFKEVNVTFLVSLTFVVAASTNLPLIVFTLYWRRFNMTGAVTGVATGFSVSILFVMLGPEMMNSSNGWLLKEAVIPLSNPGIITIPLGFLGAIVGTLVSKPEKNKEHFDTVFFKALTGFEKKVKNWNN
ncbi:solute symporter family protein [Virgibacillus sp. W0181]|uniref:solute symporter family protein n=1 Tax=Virgibacillus sp. W0181 TaxID=3391581 RepID=UPI003F47E624